MTRTTVMVGVLSTLLLSGCVMTGTPDSRPAPNAQSVSASLLEQTTQEAFEGSDVVILATVAGPQSEFVVEEPAHAGTPGAGWRWTCTEWSVVPHKVYKTDGDVREGVPVSVALRGNGLDGVEVFWGPEATLAPGEEVLLFLGSDTGPGTAAPGRYFTNGFALGKYRIDRRTGMAVNLFEDRSVRFADLERELR